ncbi:probable glycosyltransferase At5g03795 isoform X1 [Cynara cardunculus var. scolymus]|uniref:probable glycosyltransferase At5g03795 isoform X1 n=2 Tax=Cynara cardunculus var. scolymus TaxID=59895 RepID=UPI000D626B86|nr:probable glycosyltransferase At5g03795 isoform X1 [Cynara cardunculus var. scolymus]
MGHEIQYILESKRLVWLVAVVFAVVILFQYFEFPYGDVASSLFSAGRAQPPVSGSYPPQASPQIPKPLGNITRFDGSNYTRPVDEMVDNAIDKGNDVGIENDFESERDGDTDEFTRTDDGHGVSGDQIEEIEGLAPEKVRQFNGDLSTNNVNSSTLQEKVTGAASPITPFLLSPASSPDSLTSKTTVDATAIAPSTALDNSTSKPNIVSPNSAPNFKEPVTSLKNPNLPANDSSMKEVPLVKENHETPMGDVVTVSDMHDILLHNRASVRSMKPLWSSMVDQELLDAKLQIENAPANDNDHALYPPLYRNVSRFKRSYELMEKTLKVYVYKEGAKPIFHQPQVVLSGIYASEGWFMKHMKENKHFVTNNPKQAHLFYIPFSSRMLEEKLYVVGSGSRDNLVQHLKDYIHLIAERYDSWNRTGGSDHFLVACHDWATDETKKSMNSCIRALCNSDVKKEGFELGKDVSLPETYVRSPQNPLRELGGKPPSQRSFLAFFAGQMHGDVRRILLHYWENKDPDMKIFGKLKKSKNNRNYIQYMKSSKYCICAKGYEVNSPRVVEAIFHECVPVIISDNFVPPFFEILNWESFAVFVLEKDIPNLKKILVSISERRYLVMQQRVKKVQQHFLWHVKPVKYDIFHMILHSIWYNRVFRVDPIN